MHLDFGADVKMGAIHSTTPLVIPNELAIPLRSRYLGVVKSKMPIEGEGDDDT
jgi:hypothetical protein